MSASPSEVSPDVDRLRDLVLEILDENHVMSVATVRSDGWPQVTQVNYLRLGRTLYFVVARDSQKFMNISRDSRISMALGGGASDKGSARGLSMAARATEVTDPARIDEINKAIFSLPKTAGVRPHPPSLQVAVVEARPTIISIIDYSQPPGHIETMHAVEDWRLEKPQT